jgi:hypothetical protein
MKVLNPRVVAFAPVSVSRILKVLDPGALVNAKRGINFEENCLRMLTAKPSFSCSVTSSNC